MADFAVTFRGDALPESDGKLRDKNGFYSEMETAREWSLTPRQWYECERSERATMIAQSIIKARIENAVLHGDK